MKLDLNIIINFLTINKDMISYILLAIISAIFGDKGGFTNAKLKAINAAEDYLKNQTNPLSDDDKLNKAVDYFYDFFLTKYIPNGITRILIVFILPKDKVKDILKKEIETEKQKILSKLEEIKNKPA